jgi:hypothetical protein
MIRSIALRASAAFVAYGALMAQPALADVIMVPTGTKAPPMSQAPAPTDDSSEEIAKDAQRDLKDTRFYNKPGASRADYNADWQRCRLIARGSQTPGGSIPYYYNPAVVSPLAAGIGAGIGGMIGAAIVEGQQRRANRRQCLMINGWRQVEVPPAAAERIAAMSDEERDAFFNTIVGAAEVDGEITERKSFAPPPEWIAAFDGPVTPGNQVTVLPRSKQAQAKHAALGVDAAAEDEAVIVFAYRRPTEPAQGRSGHVRLLRYRPDLSDLAYQPRDWKKVQDFTTYSLAIPGKQKKLAYEAVAVRVTPGTYVYDASSVGTVLPMTTNCFGAPMITVKAGDVVYAGDFIPVINGRDAAGKAVTGLLWTSHVEDARQALTAGHPAWAKRLQPAEWRNVATYACAGMMMDRYDLPGFPERDPAPAVAENSSPDADGETSADAVTSAPA